MKKEIRIVSRGGKYTFRWVLLDSDGEVEVLLKDEVDLRFRSYAELADIIDMLNVAKKKPSIMVNSCNKKLYGEEDLD